MDSAGSFLNRWPRGKVGEPRSRTFAPRVNRLAPRATLRANANPPTCSLPSAENGAASQK